MIEKVVKRSGAVVPFNPERITNAIFRAAVAVGGRDRATAEKLSQQVVEYLESQLQPGRTPTVEEVQDAVEKILIENGHAKVAKAYILYREERSQARLEHARRSGRPSENIPWAKIWEVLNWSVDHQVNTVAGLNTRIANGEYSDIVQEAEAAYDEDLSIASELIVDQQDKLKIVFIAGPSSSGKTTTTNRLKEKLKKKGLSLVALNVDNYFFDLALQPKDEFGDYDFETPQALDLALINEQLVRLVSGKEVMIPYYDFKAGRRTEKQTPMKMGPKDIVLIDSLHGLFPDMTKDVPEEMKFKLYLEPLLQMKDSDGEYVRWTDLRLIRRMLRDSVHRAYKPRQTLEHWHYVRSSEMRNIIPHVNETNYILNTSFPYELSLYRPRVLAYFAEWSEVYKNDPLREDAFLRACRIYKLLQQISPIDDDSCIPHNSVMREFIGGSIYDAA
jgi:uridine kinase